AHSRPRRDRGALAALRAPVARRARRAGTCMARAPLDVGVVMARKTSFYYSFLVLPAEQRRAIVSVWDFCRAVDDAIDEDAGTNGVLPTGRAAVGFWRAELAKCYEGGAPETPQGRGLQPFIAAFNLPRQAFEDVIDGVAMDLDTT